MSLADIRREYLGAPLSEAHSDPNPMRQFSLWFEQLRDIEPDPTAMALATATPDGRPSVRTVLLKGVDDRGFVFYTNYESRKAREMEATGRASLLFFWRALERQVRIDGTVERVSPAESDAYFATRPLDSRLSVYASRQSEAIESRDILEDAAGHLATRLFLLPARGAFESRLGRFGGGPPMCESCGEPCEKFCGGSMPPPRGVAPSGFRPL